jgi:hypothetical protein
MPINWESVNALTRSKYIPVLADNIYKSNPLFVLLDRRDRIVLDGGVDIREPVLMGKEPVTWYSGFDPLDITPADPIRQLVLQWKKVNVAVTIDGESEFANSGEPQVMSLVQARLRNAELTIRDTIGDALFSDGTNPKLIDGLRAAINTGNTYAGINRATNTWWNSNRTDMANAEPSFSLIQQYAIGPATQGDTSPDLIVTTQAIWNKLHAQALPQWRAESGDEVLVGWPVIRYQRARIVVDSHCPAGWLFAINTEFCKLVVHRERDFAATDWLPALNQDARTMHIRWAGNLLVNNPRFHAALFNLNES